MKKRNNKIGKKTQTNSQLTDSPTWVASGETLFLMCGIIGTCDVNAWLKFSESYTLIRPKVHLAVFKTGLMYNKWGNVDEKIIRYDKHISEYNHLQQIYNTWKKKKKPLIWPIVHVDVLWEKKVKWLIYSLDNSKCKWLSEIRSILTINVNHPTSPVT